MFYKNIVFSMILLFVFAGCSSGSKSSSDVNTTDDTLNQETNTTITQQKPIISDFYISIDENTTLGTVIGNIDIELNKEENISITSFTISINDYFSIDKFGYITTTSNLDYELNDSYSLIVYATNIWGNSSVKDCNITINNIPEIVPTIEGFDATIDENISKNSIVSSVNILNQGDSNISQYVLSNYTSSFYITSTGEILTSQEYYNHDVKSYYDLKVYATNEAGNSEVVDVDIYINDLFEEAKLLDTNVKGIAYITNSKTGITDENGTLQYDINDENIIFKIGGIVLGDINTSDINIDKNIFIPEILGLARANQSDENLLKVLRLIQSLDSDVNTSNGIDINTSASNYFINLDINISDMSIQNIEDNLTSNSITLISEIEALNHFQLTLKDNGVISNIPPVFTNIQAISTVENNTSFFYDFNASDLDEDTITYSIDGNESSSFDINETTGKLTFNINPDFETKINHIFNVIANDGYGGIVSREINVTVINDDYSRGISHNDVDYGFIQATNNKWLDRNIGALEVCDNNTTNSINNKSNCTGYYYQWGRGNDGHQNNPTSFSGTAIALDTNSSSFIINISDWLLVTEVDGDNKRIEIYSKVDGSSVCPKEFRVPTIAELKQDIIDPGNVSYNSIFRLPSSGYRKYNDAHAAIVEEHNILLMSNTIDGNNKVLKIDPNTSNLSEPPNTMANGINIRCIED